MITITADVNVGDVDQTLKNLAELKKSLFRGVARAMSSIGVDLLSAAQPRVPVEYEHLRESGKAYIEMGVVSNFIVASGNGDGSVTPNLKWLNSYAPSGERFIKLKLQYQEYADWKGQPFDVAVWCHEVLRPYEERTGKVNKEERKKREAMSSPFSKEELETSVIKFARTPGTGPKYLELPFAERKEIYTKFLNNLMSKKQIDALMAKSIKVTKGASNKYETDVVKFTDTDESYGIFR